VRLVVFFINVEAIVTEPEHGIFEHQAHYSRLHRAGSLDMLTRMMIWMERERLAKRVSVFPLF